MNAAALADIKDNNEFKVVIMSYDYDYVDTAPTSLYELGMYFGNYGTSRAPKIDYTEAVTGYGNNVSGVASADISVINGIATANISKVNGI